MPEYEKLALSETRSILADIPGGTQLLKWFSDEPNFGDAEVISLSLDRVRECSFKVAVCKLIDNGNWKTAVVTMILKDMIDVSIEGFSHQNVIGGLTIGRVTRAQSDVHPSLLGIGGNAPHHRIVLRPCAGAIGAIVATIASISFEDRDDAFLWQKEK